MGSVYQAAREQAAVIDRSDRGRIAVKGEDRRSYLQGLFTNDTAALKAGEGCYTAYLTPQGRMIADLWVYELGDLILLSLGGEVKDTVLAKLDQFIFTEDVQLGDVSDTFAQYAVVGPQAARVVSSLVESIGRDVLAAMPEHGNLRVQIAGRPAVITRVTDTGEPGFDVYVERSQAAAFVEALASAGVPQAGADVAEMLRIEAGMPVFHRDMDEDTIPLEAGIESRAISFTKGCYVGQEVIVRVLHRGHGRVAKKLVGVVLEDGAVPPPGAVVTGDGREIGRVTSSARSPALRRPIALAYVHRDFAAAGTPVAVAGAPGIVTNLPFVPAGAARG
jgi:folate-binding protein YgfZ